MAFCFILLLDIIPRKTRFVNHSLCSFIGYLIAIFWEMSRAFAIDLAVAFLTGQTDRQSRNTNRIWPNLGFALPIREIWELD